MTRGRLRMARGRLRMARVPKTGRLRMARCRLRMAGRLRMAEVSQTSRLRMARSHLRIAMAFNGWPGFSLQAVHGWRESPIGSRKAAMYHCTSKWERGPPPPDRLRMAHWSSADGPTGARTGGELRELTGTTALHALSHFPGRASCAGFTGAYCGWRTQSRYHGSDRPLCGKWSRSENLCPQNLHITMFVTAPVLESLPVVAE